MALPRIAHLGADPPLERGASPAPGGCELAARHRRAAPHTPSRRASSRSPSRGVGFDQLRSTRAGAASRPRHEPAPAAIVASTRGIWSLRATSTTCTGPAPPVATIVNSRGSWPFSAMWMRAAAAMFSFTMSQMPHATSVAESFELSRRASEAPPRARSRLELHLAAEEVVGVEIAQHEIGVGHRRLGPALAVARRARDRRPRSPGPTLSSPSSFTCAIEPPPAPISIRSMLGMRIGSPEPRLKRCTRAALEAVRDRAARRRPRRTLSRWCRPCRTRVSGRCR